MSYSLSDCYKLIVNGKSLTIKCDNLSLVTINKNNKVLVTSRIVRYLSNIALVAQNLPTNFVHLGTLDNTLADYISRASYTKDGNISHTNKRECTPEQSFMSLNDKPEMSTDCDKDLYSYYKQLHNNFHWSVEKTIKSLHSYGVPVNKDLIQEAWLECPYCNKLKRSAPLAKLKFRQNPNRPFEEIHIDHIIKKNENKSSHGYTAALTIKCGLTRFFFCFPVKDVQIRSAINILQNCFMSVGRIPLQIYADNAFDCVSMHKFCETNKIKISFRASNLSRSVSVESTHRRLHEKIASMLGDKPKSAWHEVAWKAAMSINCQAHDSTGYSPYYLFFGRNPEYLGSTDVPCNALRDKYWEYDLHIAKQLADKARLSRASHYKYPIFEPGDRVVVRVDNTKHAGNMSAEIVSDEGGATATVKLDNRSRPIQFHKGMIFTEKLSPAWKRLYKTNRDFSKFQHIKTPNNEASDKDEPIATRLRSKVPRLDRTVRRKLRAVSSSPYTRLSKK